MTQAIEQRIIKPQKGPQLAFLTCPADIAIMGGSAGGSKTFSQLMDMLRHIKTPGFRGVIFRRTTEQIRKQGSLWDQSGELYTHTGGKPRENTLDWTWPTGSKVKFDAIQYDRDLDNHHSSQICAMHFDELQQFTKKMFFYMFSRNRSTCGVRPYIRGGCNPDPDSFLAEFIAWWIDQETGFPIAERGGVIRWMVRLPNNGIDWFDLQGDAVDSCITRGVPYKEAIHIPKSVTFIPSKLEDNQILMDIDPQYKSNLEALPLVDRERLLHGNWKIREAAGNFFRAEWIEKVPMRPAEMVSLVRYWDRAATEPNSSNDPDWTVGVLMGKCKQGLYWILDVIRRQYSPYKVETLIVNTAKHDTKLVSIGLEQEPGASGKMEAQHLAKKLAGYNVTLYPATNAKTVQAKPLSAQCEAGNVKMVDASWNTEYMAIMEGFPDAKHDDDVDASSGAFNHIATTKTIRVH